MYKMTKDLYDISKMLTNFRERNYTVSDEDMGYIKEIRRELTNIAGPEDIDALEIIKKGLNKKFGVDNIPNSISETFTPNAIRHALYEYCENDIKDSQYLKQRKNIERHSSYGMSLSKDAIKNLDKDKMLVIGNMIHEYINVADVNDQLIEIIRTTDFKRCYRNRIMEGC